MPRPRVAVLCDVGGPVYHVGDEPMAHAAVALLGARGVSTVLLTGDVEQAAAYYGPKQETAQRMLFEGAPEIRARRLADVRRLLTLDPSTLPEDEPLRDLRATLSGVDALLIGGGGNLATPFGWLLTERVATALVAQALGKPVVLSGQTLGPELNEADRADLTELLRTATLVGLREDASYDLARELVPDHSGLRRCLDDAVLLPGLPEVSRNAEAPLEVTVNAPPRREDHVPVAAAYARLVDAAAVALGAPVEFVPHLSTMGTRDRDAAFQARVARSMEQPATCREISPALETAARTRRARAIITSRYHPVIFGTPHGVPTLAIASNEYTVIRTAGAFRRLGVPEAPIDLDALMGSGPLDWSLLEPLLSPARRAAQDQGGDRRIRWRQDLWWDELAAALVPGRNRLRFMAYRLAYPHRRTLAPWLRRARSIRGRASALVPGGKR